MIEDVGENMNDINLKLAKESLSVSTHEWANFKWELVPITKFNKEELMEIIIRMYRIMNEANESSAEMLKAAERIEHLAKKHLLTKPQKKVNLSFVAIRTWLHKTLIRTSGEGNEKETANPSANRRGVFSQWRDS
jgi:hypothetical protein